MQTVDGIFDDLSYLQIVQLKNECELFRPIIAKSLPIPKESLLYNIAVDVFYSWNRTDTTLDGVIFSLALNLATRFKTGAVKQVVERGVKLEDYYVDLDGNIISTKFGSAKKLKTQPGTDHNPYPKVGLSVDGAQKTVLVHRIVCETYHKKPLPKLLIDEEWDSIDPNIKSKLIEYISHADRYQVNHIDHTHDNPHPLNLEWVTASENQQKYQEHRQKIEEPTRNKELKQPVEYSQKQTNKYDISRAMAIDVFGKSFVRTKCCALCEEEKPVTEFYTKSRKSKLSSEHGRRSLCKICYNKTNGNYLWKKDESDLSFDDFFYEVLDFTTR